MVNMIGFAPKTTEYNTAAFGEAGHYFSVRTMSAGRVKISFPCGSAVFDSLADARLFVDHPGDVGPAARFYLATASGVAV